MAMRGEDSRRVFASGHGAFYAVPERRTKFANRAALPVDDAGATVFVILRLMTRKASDAIGIALSSSLCWGL